MCSWRRTRGSHTLLPEVMASIIIKKKKMFLLRLSAIEGKEERCTSRREKSSSLNGPRLRGRATSIWRVIPGDVGRAPKNFECPRNRGASSTRVYKGALTWGYHYCLTVSPSFSYLSSPFLSSLSCSSAFLFR